MTMQVIKLKNLHDAACRNIRCIGKYKGYDRGNNRNKAILEEVFNRLMREEYSYFALISDTSFKCYTRSPRNDNCIQLSAGFYKNGVLYPTYDRQFFSAEDMIDEGYQSGYYKIGLTKDSWTPRVFFV